SEPVLVDFWAEWCGPCKMIAPALDQLAEEYDGKVKIAKVNVDHNRATAMKYHVRSIPMLLLFKDGQVQQTQIGAVGKGQLAQMIDRARCPPAPALPAPPTGTGRPPPLAGAPAAVRVSQHPAPERLQRPAHATCRGWFRQTRAPPHPSR